MQTDNDHDEDCQDGSPKEKEKGEPQPADSTEPSTPQREGQTPGPPAEPPPDDNPPPVEGGGN